MKDPFVYIPPNATTTPLYAEVREAETRALSEIKEAISLLLGKEAYDKINLACKSLYEVIERVCPSTADKSAAQRCVVLARMAANEAVTAFAEGPFDDIVRQCVDNLRAARWQACRAIALNTPHPDEVFVGKALAHDLAQHLGGGPLVQDSVETVFAGDIARKVLPISEVREGLPGEPVVDVGRGLSFGVALDALKAGRRVCREGWNGKGMWLTLIRGGNALHRSSAGSFDMQDCIGMKTAQAEMQPGWLASQADMLADDWTLLA